MRKGGLFNQIFLILFLQTLIFVLAFGLLVFFLIRSSTIETTKNHLISVSTAKKTAIHDILQERENDLKQVGRDVLLALNLKDYQTFLQPEVKEKILRQMFRYRYHMPAIKDIYFADPSGRVLHSTDTSFLGEDISGDKAFIYGKSGERGVFDFKGQAENLKFRGASPIRFQDDLIAVLVVDFRGSSLSNLAKDNSGLGETGETVLYEKLPYNIYKPLHSLKKTDTLCDMNFLDNLGEGFYSLNDYQDDKVFASVVPIAGTNLGLLSKIDESEALRSLNSTTRFLILTCLIAAVAAFGISSVISKAVVEPVRRLETAASSVSKGHLEVVAINDHSDNEIGRLATAFNSMVTSLRKSREKLTKKMEELNESNEALNKFAYIVSHDLKAPLQAMEALLTALKEDNKETLSPDALKMCDMMNIKLEEMQGFIAAILKYSKSGNSRDIHKINSGEIVDKALNNVMVPANIEVKVDKLPEVMYDPVWLVQIFQNLISNALKYNDKEQGWVHVGCEPSGSYYRFFVKDNGPGIPEDAQEKIFFLFTQNIQNNDVDSSGIGLSIVKKLIEKSGGKIWLESTPGEGTTFYFTVPKAPVK